MKRIETGLTPPALRTISLSRYTSRNYRAFSTASQSTTGRGSDAALVPIHTRASIGRLKQKVLPPPARAMGMHAAHRRPGIVVNGYGAFHRHLASGRSTSLSPFQQHDRLRLVEDGRVNVDADQDQSRIVGRAMARIAFVRKPHLPVVAYSSRIFWRSRESVARPETDIHSRVRSL